jgi:hypothetical protein
MRWHNWLAAAVVLVTTGCVSVKTRTAPGIDLSRFQTFSFFEPTDPTQIAFTRSLAGQSIRNQVAADLRQKGMVEVAAGQPTDMVVAYHARLQRRFNYVGWGYGPGWSYGWGWGGYYGRPMVSEYTEGTIIVDFLDPHTKTVVWRGTASGGVNDEFNPDPGKIANAVNKMMRSVPESMASIERRAM